MNKSTNFGVMILRSEFALSMARQAVHASALSLALAAPAFAGSLEEPEVAPALTQILAPPPPPVQDWTGSYAGLSLSAATSTNNYYEDGAFSNGPHDLEGNVAGVFGGYNFQRGNLVYGGEIGASFGEVRGLPSGFEEQEYSRVIDLKGRAGYAAGSFLIYGALGYSFSGFAEDGEDDVILDGISYGVGVDYSVGSRYFVGLEYYRRSQEGTLDYAPAFSIEDTTLDTLSLRAGMSF